MLLGGLAASTLAAALGRWISMPDPLKVLHTIAAGHNFHAPVALHAQGLYLAAPLLGLVLFLALTAAFTKPTPPTWKAYSDLQEQGYFSTGNPYGFPGGAQQQPQPQLGPPQQLGAQPQEQPLNVGPGADGQARCGRGPTTTVRTPRPGRTPRAADGHLAGLSRGGAGGVRGVSRLAGPARLRSSERRPAARLARVA